MRLSCRDNSFPLLSHEGAFAVIADLGLDAVDVSVSPRHDQLDPGAVVTDPIGSARRVASAASRHGLAVADVFVLTGFGPDVLSVNEPEPDARSRSRSQFDALLAFAAELGAPGVTILPGERWEADPAEGLRVAAGELAWRAARATDASLALSFEPHARSNVTTPDAVLDLLAIAPGVTLTLDHSHFVLRGMSDADVDCLLPYVRHVQARQAAPGHLQVRVADGCIDYPRVLDALDSLGYDGFVGLEYTWNDWIDEVDTLAQTALLRDVLRAAAAFPIGATP